MLRLVRSLAELTSKPAKRRSPEGFFLPADRFELAATAERMRVDRNKSVVSLLLIELSSAKKSPQDIQSLESRMAARLRLTDSAGWMRDGRLGVLLPDTPESGAWKVASDLCEAYPAGADRPACEVVVYPDPEPPSDDPGSEDQPGPKSAVRVGANVATDHLITNGVADPVDATPGPATSVGKGFDSAFVKPLPTWKRAIDVVGASVGLVAAVPLILVCGAAVRLTTRGPAIFVQEREGLGGRTFKIYKLRTMHQDAERVKSRLRRKSEQDGPAFKLTNDPRVTALGRLLRKTSLDELPQLWNVLRGDMSLVGPRPLPVDESLACTPWQRRRLLVTPGITCTWQIYGRNMVPFDDWIRMDLEYAQKRSPLLDLKLVAKTGAAVVLRKGR